MQLLCCGEYVNQQCGNNITYFHKRPRLGSVGWAREIQVNP